MGKRLRINNLSDDTTVEDLKALFSGVGAIARARISKEEETGLSRGYGFVEMETDDAARSAIAALNGRTLKGREIRVGAVRSPSSGDKSGGRSDQPRRLKRS
jgi:RNA recognition motif-containing protein